MNIRPTKVVINLENLAYNLNQVKTKVPNKKIMAMVKANAYGHSIIEVSKKLIENGVDYLGVAFLEEGIALRNAGINIPILVTSGILEEEIPYLIDNNLEITVSSTLKLNQVEKISKEKNKKASVHLKIDTGMERIGVHYYSCSEFLEESFASPDVDIKGVYSHLACADDLDCNFTKIQLERFLEVIKPYRTKKVLFHIANSAGIISHPETHLDMVRPGIMLYGSYPNAKMKNLINLKPVMSLISKINYFKVVKKGHSVSYGATWIATEDTRVVTIPIGYGDGYFRSLSNKARVLINGKRYPIIGKICMDQLMVDIGNDSAFNGEEVVLLGVQGSEQITAEELGILSNTISYEIFTNLNNRLPREFINKSK